MTGYDPGKPDGFSGGADDTPGLYPAYRFILFAVARKNKSAPSVWVQQTERGYGLLVQRNRFLLPRFSFGQYDVATEVSSLLVVDVLPCNPQ